MRLTALTHWRFANEFAALTPRDATFALTVRDELAASAPRFGQSMRYLCYLEDAGNDNERCKIAALSRHLRLVCKPRQCVKALTSKCKKMHRPLSDLCVS